MAKHKEPKQVKETVEKPAEEAQAPAGSAPAPEAKVHPKFHKFLKGEK